MKHARRGRPRKHPPAVTEAQPLPTFADLSPAPPDPALVDPELSPPLDPDSALPPTSDSMPIEVDAADGPTAAADAPAPPPPAPAAVEDVSETVGYAICSESLSTIETRLVPWMCGCRISPPQERREALILAGAVVLNGYLAVAGERLTPEMALLLAAGLYCAAAFRTAEKIIPPAAPPLN